MKKLLISSLIAIAGLTSGITTTTQPAAAATPPDTSSYYRINQSLTTTAPTIAGYSIITPVSPHI